MQFWTLQIIQTRLRFFLAWSSLFVFRNFAISKANVLDQVALFLNRFTNALFSSIFDRSRSISTPLAVSASFTRFDILQVVFSFNSNTVRMKAYFFSRFSQSFNDALYWAWRASICLRRGFVASWPMNAKSSWRASAACSLVCNTDISFL